MKPGPQKRDLDRVASALLAPFLEGNEIPDGWSLVGWDTEQGLCLTFACGDSIVLVEFERRNDELGCYTRTDRFNVCTRRQFEDPSLSDRERRFVDAVIDIVRRREHLLAPDAVRPTDGKPILREVLVDRVLMSEGGNRHYINPYVGCMIGCSFCYVIDRADFSRQLDGQPEIPWGQYVDVKVNAAEVLARETRDDLHGIVRMSPILTDPYQPAERRYRITRQCLEVLRTTRLAPVVLTRAARVVEDVDLLASFPRALVGFSIPTDIDEYRRIFEPKADPIEDRLAALRTIHAAGIGTFAVIQPVFPMNVERMVEMLAPYVRAVRLDKLYLTERVQHLYDRHDLGAYATDAFAEETIGRLTEGFHSRGVRVDPLDDLEALLPAG